MRLVCGFSTVHAMPRDRSLFKHSTVKEVRTSAFLTCRLSDSDNEGTPSKCKGVRSARGPFFPRRAIEYVINAGDAEVGELASPKDAHQAKAVVGDQQVVRTGKIDVPRNDLKARNGKSGTEMTRSSRHFDCKVQSARKQPRDRP